MKREAFWSALEAFISAGFSVVTSFLIARIIGPAELGAGTAAAAPHVVLWVVVNALFADAIVQRATINDRMLSSALWASCIVGGGGMLIQAAAGVGLARVFGENRLMLMGLVLAAPLPLVGAGGVIQGLLTRERSYRNIALRTIIGQGMGSAVGVTAALAGAGAWAVVLQQAVTSSCGALAILIGRSWRPARCLDRCALRDMLSVGLPLTASTLVLIARYRLFALLIGASAGAAVLGQVHLAFRLVDTVRELTFTALWRLMLPAMAEKQHDPPALLALVDRWLRRCAIAILPVCAALAVGLQHAVAAVMGPEWQAAGQAAMPLTGLMAVSVIMFPSSVALVATGKATLALYGNLASLLAVCVLAVIVPPDDPWPAILLWITAHLLVCPYALWVNARALGVRTLRPLSGGFWSARGVC